jgi:hypothetical protein
MRRTLLALALAASSLSATPFGLSEPLWSFLNRLWVKEGCSIDPHGRCITGAVTNSDAPAQSDHGCHIDPHGGCTGH